MWQPLRLPRLRLAFYLFLHRVTATSALWIASSRSVVLDRVKPATLDDQLTERSASSRILPHRLSCSAQCAVLMLCSFTDRAWSNLIYRGILLPRNYPCQCSQVSTPAGHCCGMGTPFIGRALPVNISTPHLFQVVLRSISDSRDLAVPGKGRHDFHGPFQWDRSRTL